MTTSSAVASTRVRCGTARRSPGRHGFPAPIPSARATGRSSPSMIPTVIRGWSRRSQRGTPAGSDTALQTRDIHVSTKTLTMKHIILLLRGIIRTHVVLGLTFTAAIIPLLAGNRPASETAAAPTVRNVVLVHGAFADGSSWAKVIPLLEARGLHVAAVQNPLSSLADDVAATKRAIAMQEGPVILVGHSWAGMVISEAGNDPKVTGLVYVAALVPDEGQAANDVLKPYTPEPGFAEVKPDAWGFLSLTRKGIDEDFAPDVPAAERAIVYATHGTWNSACLCDKVSAPAWTTKPSWFIAVSDRMLSPEYEQAIAKHIHATTTTLPTGHVPMLSKPKDVAAVIIDAANKAGRQ